MWYHLSRTEWPEPVITKLRQTEHGYGEDPVDRFSVSPTFARAVLACPHTREGGPLFIYQVHVTDPVPAKTGDKDISHERIIDQAVFDRHDRRVAVTLVGQLLVESDQRDMLMRAINRWGLDMTHDEEQELLWEIKEGVWRVRDYTNSIEGAKALTAIRNRPR